ncbi:MAG: hypothetical protein JWM11_7519 [Planctomycetaceae bacterium]|nr:hypothetical protein [Planctomycetaceae bacterium]
MIFNPAHFAIMANCAGFIHFQIELIRPEDFNLAYALKHERVPGQKGAGFESDLIP